MSDGDIKQVAAIEKEIFSLPWSEKSFLDSLKNENTVYIVAEIKDEIVAYCGAYISFEEADISNVAVKENFRRKNVAENMLNKLFYECGKKGVSDITLEVRETNVPVRAQLLFQSYLLCNKFLPKMLKMKPLLCLQMQAHNNALLSFLLRLYLCKHPRHHH